ncbi:unnamed protein product, partial [Polarella glacialis]
LAALRGPTGSSCGTCADEIYGSGELLGGDDQNLLSGNTRRHHRSCAASAERCAAGLGDESTRAVCLGHGLLRFPEQELLDDVDK